MIEKHGNRNWYRSAKSFYKLGKKGSVVHVVASMAACLTLTFSTPALALPLVPTTTTISDARTTTQALANSSNSIIVTKDGSITVSDEMAIDGSCGLYGSSIINDGTLEVTNLAEDEDAFGIKAENVSGGSSITNSSTIKVTNSAKDGDIFGIEAENVSSDSLITNSGTIEAANSAKDGDAYGIKVGGYLTHSSVKNSGTITLSSSFHSDTLGSTRGGLYGLYANSDANSSITNSGTISVSADSVYGTHGIVNYGTATVTNSGTISLSADLAIYMSGISNYINGEVINSGTISLSADLAASMSGILSHGTDTVTNSGTISLSADQTSFSKGDTEIVGIFTKGDVINSGTVTATTGAGDLTDNFYSIMTDGRLINSGTLSGRLKAGDTTNSGLIQLSLGTSSITGDFIQDKDGTLGITLYSDASGNTDFSTLSVSGSTTLADNSGIYVDVTTASENQSILVGDTLTGVIDSTGGIAADTNTLSVTDNSVLLDFTASLSGGDTSLDLTVEQSMSILESTGEGGQSGVKGAAAALDGLSGTTNSEITNFISNLNTLTSVGRVAKQVAGAAPVNNTQAPAVADQLVNTMSSVLQARQEGVRGLNSGDSVFSEKNLWVKPFAITMEQDDLDGVNGFSADAYGIGIGMDKELSSKDRLGLALFYTRANTDTNNLDQESDTSVFNLMAYGSRPIYNKTTTLFWQAGGGIQDMESSRYIQALNKTATADYTASNLFARTRASRAFQVTQDVTLSAGASVSYFWFYTPSYTESGTGGMNLSVDSGDTQSLVTALEGGISWAAAKDVQITANASMGYDLIDDDTAVSSQFQGGGVSFTTQGIDNSPVVFTAGLGVGKKLSNSLSLDANYDLEGRGDDFLSHMLSIKFNWIF